MVEFIFSFIRRWRLAVQHLRQPLDEPFRVICHKRTSFEQEQKKELQHKTTLQHKKRPQRAQPDCPSQDRTGGCGMQLVEARFDPSKYLQTKIL